jgi:hypothetical protein
MRTAIELEDPTSSESLRTLNELAKTTVGEDCANDYELAVEKAGEDWAKVKMKLPIHNRILKLMLKEVSADATGRLDI